MLDMHSSYKSIRHKYSASGEACSWLVLSLQSTKLSLTGKQKWILKADCGLLFSNSVPLKEGDIERQENLRSHIALE